MSPTDPISSRSAAASPAVRFVLVETSHPGNIGAVARAMKNMALRELMLVRPRLFPHAEATARASGADDLLAQARVVDTVAEGLAGCGLVLGTTSRERESNFRVIEVREAADRIARETGRGRAAVLFGNERTGLTNEDLAACHALLRVPANPEYASLNLAMAAQLVAYEIYRARDARPAMAAAPAPSGQAPLAPAAELERLYEHLGQVLEEIDFRDRTRSGTHLMTRLRRLLQRAEPDANEVNILRGILTAVQNRRRTAGSPPPPAATVVPAAAARARTVRGSGEPLFLDFASTTPVDPRVREAMEECLGEDGCFGNPASATHDFGRAAARRVASARAAVARLIGAQSAEVVFTSGATESDNLALLGLMRANSDRGRHLVTSRLEHKAVLDTARQLEREGFAVTWLEPGADGVPDPQAVRAALRADTLLVSLMHVNNETGAISDIPAIGAICRERNVLLHTDAAQGVGRLALEVSRLGADLVSFTAHKLYGPKGIGALWVGERARPWLKPVLFGGGHELGLRSGTLATHQIAGFGVACDLAGECLASEATRLEPLRERLWTGLQALGGVLRNSPAGRSVPAILNVSFEGVEGESLIAALTDLAVSSGSACTSATLEPSYVLRALGRRAALAQASLRLSLGRPTTAACVDRAVVAIGRAVTRLRAAAPPQGATAVLLPSLPAEAASPRAAWREGLDPLTPAARRLFEALPGCGSLEGTAAGYVLGEAGSETAEARVRFELAVVGDTVKDARFRAWGCPHTLAVAAWVTAALAGRRRDALVPGTPEQWRADLGVPIEKLGRLLVVEDALRECVRNWP